MAREAEAALKALALTAIVALTIRIVPVQAQDSVGIIRGFVFVDANENALPDEGEEALAGVDIEAANGESILAGTAAEDGTFSFEVSEGLWRVTLQVPEGYAVLNEANREVVIGVDGVLEANLDFALRALSPPPDEVETPVGETPTPGPQPDIILDPGNGTGDGLPPDDPTDADPDLPVLLPESGSGLPPRVIAAILLIGSLGVATAAIWLGRRLAAG